MISIEKLSNEMYETLLELRYPGLAQSASRNIVETVLAPENRLFLLSWLLAQCSLVTQEDFSTNLDELKIFKWYTNMGICNDANVLMGRVPIQEQIFTLKNLLFFMKNVLCADQSGGNSEDRSKFNEIYDKCLTEHVNIMPATWGLAKKLSYGEAIEYLEYCKNSSNRKIDVNEKSSETLKNNLSSDEIFDSLENNSEYKNEPNRKECIETFLQAFPDPSSWPEAERTSLSSISAKSMDSCIDNINSNMTALKETLRSKNEISNFVMMKQLEKHELPLDGPIEDIVIAIEEVNRLKMTE